MQFDLAISQNQPEILISSSGQVDRPASQPRPGHPPRDAAGRDGPPQTNASSWLQPDRK